MWFTEGHNQGQPPMTIQPLNVQEANYYESLSEI